MVLDSKLESAEISDVIEADLLRLHGPMMADQALSQALGFKTLVAFRQAYYRGHLPVPVFALEKRHGKFALTRDVAKWLAAQRTTARVPTKRKTTLVNPKRRDKP